MKTLTKTDTLPSSFVNALRLPDGGILMIRSLTELNAILRLYDRVPDMFKTVRGLKSSPYNFDQSHGFYSLQERYDRLAEDLRESPLRPDELNLALTAYLRNRSAKTRNPSSLNFTCKMPPSIST